LLNNLISLLTKQSTVSYLSKQSHILIFFLLQYQVFNHHIYTTKILKEVLFDCNQYNKPLRSIDFNISNITNVYSLYSI